MWYFVGIWFNGHRGCPSRRVVVGDRLRGFAATGLSVTEDDDLSVFVCEVLDREGVESWRGERERRRELGKKAGERLLGTGLVLFGTSTACRDGRELGGLGG